MATLLDGPIYHYLCLGFTYAHPLKGAWWSEENSRYLSRYKVVSTSRQIFWAAPATLWSQKVKLIFLSNFF